MHVAGQGKGKHHSQTMTGNYPLTIAGCLLLFPGDLVSAHRTMLLSSAFSLSCAPGTHWDACGRGHAHCISWHQIWLILATCYVRCHGALRDNRSSSSGP